ncbi:hypothetical protein [Roseovarius sp. D22-M7]|uniref:hypothetical protein n=1 Tax=Roseovarius sp. D22-M7 TaxID=3127116 RepID=UPI0030105369
MLPKLIAAIVLFLTSHACLSQTLQSSGPVTSNIDRSVEDLRPDPVFDGEIITEARAKEMIASFGWTLVSVDACGGNNGSCIDLTIVKKNERVFRYTLAQDRCAAGLKVSKGGLRNTRTSRTKEETIAPRRSGRPRDFCIDGHRVSSRIVLENSTLLMPDALVVKFEHTLQLPGEARWESQVTLSESDWKTGLVLPPSGRYEGWAWEVRDGDGQTLNSDSDEVQRIAADGGSEASPEARCETRANLIGTIGNTERALSDQACKMIEPDVIVVGPVEWNVSFCEIYHSATVTEIEKVRAEFMDACLANPDLVLTASDPNETVVDLAELITFQNIFEHEGVPSVCIDFTAKDVSVDMGDNLNCTGDVRFHCYNKPDGSCYCEPGAVVSKELACAEVD